MARKEHKQDNQGQEDVMTLSEIAEYLKVSDKTILRMAQAGTIPSAKVSGQWRFLRSLINDWLETKMYLSNAENLQQVVSASETLIPLSRILTPERVIIDLSPGTEEDVLRRLVQPLADEHVVSDPDEYFRRLVEREEIVSTALGHGIALPHVRNPDQRLTSSEAVVLGICKEGTDFNSLDGEPTHIFALCCSSTVAIHLRMLAKITLILRSPGMVEKLVNAVDCKEVTRHMIAADWELSATM